MAIRMRCRFFICIDPRLIHVSDSEPCERGPENGKSRAPLVRSRGRLTTTSSLSISQQSQLIPARVFAIAAATSFLFFYLFISSRRQQNIQSKMNVFQATEGAPK